MKPGIALRASLMSPALALLAATPVSAGTSTSQFRVTLTIQAECKLTAANDIGFGADEAIGAPCVDGTPYSIGLNAGAGTGATVNVRKVSATGGGTMNYMLYRDAAATQIWGDTISANPLSTTGNGAVQSFTVYGRVPAQSTLAAGNYSDTIQVVITY